MLYRAMHLEAMDEWIITFGHSGRQRKARRAHGQGGRRMTHEPRLPAPPPPRPAERVDICVLGPGAGGRFVAVKAAEAGASVVHISPPGWERGLPGLAVGTRAFIEAAALFHARTTLATLGLAGAEADAARQNLRPTGEGLVRHMHAAAEALAGGLADARLRALRVRVLSDVARFENAKTLRVGDERFAARHFVLAPALQWAMPAIPGLNEIDCLTPDRPLVASRPVERLAVIGTTDAALALAQAHRRLGARVTLLRGEEPADATPLDEEALRHVLMGLERDGVAVRTDLAAVRIEAHGREALVHAAGAADTETFDVSQVLVAPPTRAVFGDAAWQEAQVALRDDGAPVLDAFQRTSNRRIQAIGAIGGGDLFSATLERQADVIIDHVLSGRKLRAMPATRLLPTSPEVAVVGLTEKAARGEGEIRVLRTSFAWHPARVARYRGSDPVAGEIKVVARRDGRIAGCTIIGEGAGDIAGLWTLAITRGLKLADLADLAFPDCSRHSLTRRATRLTVFGWPRSAGLLLRLARWWWKLRG